MHAEDDVHDIQVWIASERARVMRAAASIADEFGTLSNHAIMAGLGVAIGVIAAFVAPFHHVPGLPLLLIVGIAAALWAVEIARQLVSVDRRASRLPQFIGGIERDAVLKYPDVLAKARAQVDIEANALRHFGGVHAPHP